jgi:hypothetical protein
MVAPNHNSICREAELHYYDFLRNEGRGPVPEFIISHIKQCQYCREQIKELEEVLSQVQSEQKQIRTTVIDMLRVHFAYIAKHVTCQTLKPFLPGLLDTALQIKVPTPITAHLDNCHQCRKDLETIRGLNLNRKQLWRLGQLMANRSAEDTVRCSTTQLAMRAYAAMDWSGATAEALKHLCKCPVCRDLLYEERQNICTSLPEYGQSPEFPCESVSATDIFDYCFPYGIEPAEDEYAKFRSAFTSHLRSCPACLAKMQQLHKTIYGIADRPESGVVTIYHIDESAKAEALSEPDGLYAGFPIRVDVIGPKDEAEAAKSVPTNDSTATLKQKVSAINLRPLIKAGIAAAAIIFVAVGLLLKTPTAKAVTIDQVYKAIEKVKNVYISTFGSDETGSAQEKWVSRPLNIYMTKSRRQSVLWDVGNGLRKIKNLNTGEVETIRLTEEAIAGIETKMSGSLGIMPFYDISEIPADAEWSRIAHDGLEATAKDIEVYDLIWGKKALDGSVVFKKCRIFVDPKTSLPKRTQFYEKLATDTEYTLVSLRVIEYPSDSEMQIVLEDASF